MSYRIVLFILLIKMAGGNNCPCWVYIAIVVAILIFFGSTIGLGVKFGGSGDTIDVNEAANNTNINKNTVSAGQMAQNVTIQDESTAAANNTNINKNTVSAGQMAENVTIQDENTAKQSVENIMEPKIDENQESSIKNVSLTNYNNIEIFLEDASNGNDERHAKTVDEVNEHITGHMNAINKQIVYYSLIVLGIVFVGVLTLLAIQSYTKKLSRQNKAYIAQQRLVDIELSIQRLQEKVEDVKFSVDKLEM